MPRSYRKGRKMERTNRKRNGNVGSRRGISEAAERFLLVLFGTVAALLLLQLFTYYGVPAAEQAAWLPVLRERVGCLFHCLTVGIGGAMLIDVAAHEGERSEP